MGSPSPTAECRRVPVPDFRVLQDRTKNVLIELRVGPRAWDRPDIHKHFHVGSEEHSTSDSALRVEWPIVNTPIAARASYVIHNNEKIVELFFDSAD